MGAGGHGTQPSSLSSSRQDGSPQRKFGLSQTTRGSGSSQKTFFMRIQFVAGERAALHTARDKRPAGSVASIKTTAVEAGRSMGNAKTTAVEPSPSLKSPKRRPWSRPRVSNRPNDGRGGVPEPQIAKTTAVEPSPTLNLTIFRWL